MDQHVVNNGQCSSSIIANAYFCIFLYLKLFTPIGSKKFPSSFNGTVKLWKHIKRLKTRYILELAQTDLMIQKCRRFSIQASSSYYARLRLVVFPELLLAEMHFLVTWKENTVFNSNLWFDLWTDTVVKWTWVETYLWASALEYISSDTWHQAL